MSQPQKITAREKAMAYMRGWKTGAAFLPIESSDSGNLDFNKGWDQGRKASKEAAAKAEELYGYKFAVITLAKIAEQPGGPG